MEANVIDFDPMSDIHIQDDLGGICYTSGERSSDKPFDA